ncbi:MAG: hypothetical protein V3U11_11205, partial [Planctomycetota bacterium]
MRAAVSIVSLLAMGMLLPPPAEAQAQAPANAAAKAQQAVPAVQLVRLTGVFLDQPPAASGLGVLLAGPAAKPQSF